MTHQPANIQKPLSRSGTRAKYAFFVLFLLGIIGLVFWYELYPLWAADRHLSRAKAALHNYDFPQAETDLRATLRVRPDQSEAAFLLAQLLRRTDRGVEARQQLKEAERLGWVPDYIRLEQLMMNVQERGPYSSDAATVRLYIAAAHPEDRLLFEAMTQGLLKAHMLPDAAILLDRWCDRYPEDWFPRFQRGVVRESVQSIDPAMADYRFVLEKNPKHPSVRRQMADVYLAGRVELPEALALYEAQLQQFPQDVEALAGYADVLNSLGREPEAIVQVNRAVELMPTSSRALFTKANILRVKDPQTAYQFAKQAAAVKKDDPTIYFVLSQLASELGKPEESQQYLARHRTLDEQWKRLNELGRDVRLKPHDPEIRCQIGVGMMAIGRSDEGIMWFHSALNENPKYRRAHELLATHYERTSPQLAHYHRTLAQQPTDK